MSFATELMLPVHLELLDASNNQLTFLEMVFARCRPAFEQTQLPAPQLKALIHQQFLTQQMHFARQFPGYWRGVIHVRRRPVGQLQVHYEVNAKKLHLLDIGLLPDARGKGVGSSLLRAILLWANERSASVVLSVDRHNPRAQRLYSAVGFVVTEVSDTYLRMEWHSSARPLVTDHVVDALI